ncbi:MAG: hypothetical protein Q8M71_01750 [Thermodesulfovibrionales bacterium]|nr:hypothetical protein [Thermodesulfovibrionales bacterium]
MKQPRISSKNLWGNHETRVREVFSLALELLQKETLLPTQENALNRKLYFCLLRANRILQAKNRGFDYPPIYEGNNQPDSDDVARATREYKRPDFQWGFIDNLESDPGKSAKHYIVECKRLGMSTNTWILNRNYIVHGVNRFIKAEWGYAKSTKSSAMIGYIQNMEMDDIFREVNLHGKEMSFPQILPPKDGWINSGVSNLNQRLNRPEVPPTPFELRHIWVDLREHYHKT